jgi:hypothetical protein
MQKTGRSATFCAALAICTAAFGMSGCTPQETDNREAASQQAAPNQETTLDGAARAGLAALKELTAGPGAQALGIAAADADKASLGQGYDVFTVGLDQLREYRSGTPATSLIRRGPDTIIPVMVGGEVRSSMTVTQTERGFVTSEIGSGEMMQAMARSAERVPGDFLLRVPALGLQFVGRNVDGRTMLRMTSPDPRLKIRAGAEMPAEEVFTQLVPIARAYNGEPM